jgi:hypothetical protein
MKEKNKQQDRKRGIRGAAGYILLLMFFLFCAFPAGADGFRNITSLTFSYYFDDTFRVDSLDVFLFRIVPGFSLKTEVARVDAPDWFSHVFSIGPVINLTKTFYLDAVYGLGINHEGEFSHKFDASFTQETETLVVSFGARGLFFPHSGYYYYLPSMNGAIFPVDTIRIFCKIFFSWDSEDVISGSVWGELGYTFTPLFTAHAGFTVSYTDGFGYSAIGGCLFNFTDTIKLKYFFQYLGSIIEYLDRPEEKNGIANGFILDVRF